MGLDNSVGVHNQDASPYSACISSVVAGSFHKPQCQGTICSGFSYIVGFNNIGTNLSELIYQLEKGFSFMLNSHPRSHIKQYQNSSYVMKDRKPPLWRYCHLTLPSTCSWNKVWSRHWPPSLLILCNFSFLLFSVYAQFP